MKKCENINCNKEHDESYGSGRFCSKNCSHSRIKTEKIKLALSLKLKGREGIKKDLWSEERKQNFKKANEQSKETWKNKLLEEDFKNLSFQRLAKRVKLEQDDKCNKCGLDTWMGQSLILELEHKDGNHDNNKRENLEALCPNCHSLTNTWRGRNKKSNRLKVSDEVLLEAILKNKDNIRQTLIEVGLSPRGGNYKRVYKIISMMN